MHGVECQSLRSLEITRKIQQLEAEGARACLNAPQPVNVIGCLRSRANIEQLSRHSMVISMLIKRAGDL